MEGKVDIFPDLIWNIGFLLGGIILASAPFFILRRRDSWRPLTLPMTLAVAVGLGMLGFGIWRLTSGQTINGAVVGLVGAFLLFRGVTGALRRGL